MNPSSPKIATDTRDENDIAVAKRNGALAKRQPKEAGIVYRMIRKSDDAKVEVGINIGDEVRMIIPGLPLPVPFTVCHVNRGKGRISIMPTGATGVKTKGGK